MTTKSPKDFLSDKPDTPSSSQPLSTEQIALADWIAHLRESGLSTRVRCLTPLYEPSPLSKSSAD
jgi:hypothetical protein